MLFLPVSSDLPLFFFRKKPLFQALSRVFPTTLPAALTAVPSHIKILWQFLFPARCQKPLSAKDRDFSTSSSLCPCVIFQFPRGPKPDMHPWLMAPRSSLRLEIFLTNSRFPSFLLLWQFGPPGPPLPDPPPIKSHTR